jgi:hypothetical protein
MDEFQDCLNLLGHLPNIDNRVSRGCDICSELSRQSSSTVTFQDTTQNSISEVHSDIANLPIERLQTDIDHLKRSIDYLHCYMALVVVDFDQNPHLMVFCPT